MTRRIAVVTGGRADYGLLQWVMHEIRAAPDFDLQLIVTGAHLEPRFGMTVEQIEADGFAIDARVPLGLESDAPADVARAMARCLTGVSEVVDRLQPDLMLAYLLWIGIVGYGLNTLLSVARRRLFGRAGTVEAAA